MVGSMIVAAYYAIPAGVALSFGQAAVAFVINFAVSQIVTRVFTDNPEKQQDMGVREQVPPSSVNAIPVVYGDAYMGGTFVDAVLTTDQKTMYYVLAISSISSANSTLGTSAGVFNYDMSEMYYGDRLISFSSSGSVQSGRIFNGGTGYVVGDVLTISGGTFTTAAVFTVTQVSTGGVITAASLTTPGSYTSAPNNPALVTGGTGTGASGVLKFSTYTNTVKALTDEAGNVDTKINGNLYINLYKSSSAGVITSANGAAAPSTVMGGSDIAVAQRWTGTRQMNNLAFAIVKLVYNRDADTTQLNPITFNVSHYPNGASVAKPGDVWLDYITNQDYGGAVGWLPNGSFSSAFVDTSCVATLNTYSDQTISYTPAGGGATVTQARYRINGVLDAGESVLSNLDRIMSACDSWMTYNAALGKWSVVVNKAESAAYAFTDNNIIGDIRVSATDITSSINQVEARFPFKSNRDQAAFVNLETPFALLYPNEPVNKYSITYDLVNDSVQAQYLANRLLEQAREDLIVSFSTTYYGIQVDAGDVVSVTNSDYGWTNKLFRVMKVNESSLPDGSLGAKLELNEYNAQVYDDATIQQYSPSPNSGLASPSYFSALSAPTVTGFPSATIPYINVQVTVPTTGRVTFGSLFWTTVASPAPSDWKLVSTASTTNNQPVTNGSSYTFSNITLNTGTYYFAYNVGNDVTTSILSPLSSSFVWNPVAGAGAAGPFVDISGFTGFTKNAAGTAITPSTSTLTAVTQNVTTPSYSWAITGATPTSGLNSTITITPSLSATSVTASLTVNGENLTTPIVRTITMPITLDGTGTPGLNSATVYLYNKNTSTTPPTLFSGTFTYTFNTGILSTYPSGVFNGWSQTPPSIASGEYLFMSLATAVDSSETDAVPTSEFSTPRVISGFGPTGNSGDSVDIIFKRSATQPTTPSPSVLTPATWYSDVNSVPAGADPIWSSVGTNTGTGTNYTWQTPLLIEGQNGSNGLSVAEVLIYIRATSAPTTPTGGSYDFTTQTLTAPTNWFSYVPTGTDPVYTSRSVASVEGTTGTDSSLTWSSPTLSFENGATGPNGANTAIVYLYQSNTSSVTPPTSPTGTFTYTFSNATLSNTPSGVFNGWSQSVPNLTVGQYLWQKQATAFSSAETDTITGAEFSSAVIISAFGPTGPEGTSANKYATAYLYQWTSATPGDPSGSSTYTWSSGANSLYTGGNGWSPTVPTNPGTSGVSLWVAAKQVTDVSTAITTPVSWTTGFSKYVAGQNGASVPGTQTARPTVYAWSLAPAPTLTGTTLYTWSDGTYTAPSGWSTTITTAPSPGYNLYAATVNLTAAGTETQTPITWSTATVIIQGVSNFNGASSRICYTKTTLTSLASTPTTITTTGSTSFPPNDSWGTGTIWQATPPTIIAGESVYQSDGVYSPTTDNTVWNVPYLSALRVGNLAAISANTGSLTVTGTFQSNNAAISDSTMTGSGGVLYSTGLFAFGNETNNITYNGSAININGLANASSSTFTVGTDITANTSTPFSLLTFTKKNATTGLISIATSFQLMTSYTDADSFILVVYMTLEGNNGWSATPSYSRIQGVLGPTVDVDKQGGAPLTFTFMFNTNDWGSGASTATSITAGITYAGFIYDSSGALLTTSSSDWSLLLLGANNSFYQPLLGS